MTDVLSTRALNRTLLQRQFLTARTSRPALQVVEHLVALQSQEPNWPYLGLWTRLDGFRREDLTALLHDGSVVRSASLRSTQHLTSGPDFLRLRPVLQPVLDRTSRARYFAAETAGLDLDELVDAGRELTAGRTLPRRELARALAERFPGRAGRVLAGAVELRVPMVQDPAAGAWGGWGNPSNVAVTPAEHRLGAPLAPPRVETLVRRYLAAFGPAGVKDLQAWSGLTRLRGVFDTLRPQLRVLRDERGTELFDLPDAPLAPADLPVPVRFLPAFDNLLLGHADRSRVIGDDERRLVMPGRAVVHPTFLVDGFVHGTWSLRGAALRLSPFRPLSPADRRAVLAEAEQLLAFLAPDPGSDPDGPRVAFA
ncbi:winged helix DNA-binding domain-containing protein [Streptomyces sp. TLI_171]|uniref:winged helix DNA-binding domain-containing protein n=1 Tax=Streptomyces sp. TLI_171 TaxID=1938859 RepID=UPI000C1958DE|nr:winged helix DNA-binding domain-containing protein [Streptomyces sp. TLI_171]RKE18850.1 winged helix DNA-binding protein [Streptomyces sp. TLI_171]